MGKSCSQEPLSQKSSDLHEVSWHTADSSLFKSWSLGWLIDYLRFYVPLKNISLIWRRHHCRWRAAKFWLMLGAQGLWAGRDLYRATPAVTRDLGFSGLIRRTAPFSCLLRRTRGCGGSILTRILTGVVSNGALIWKSIFTCIHIEKNVLLQNQVANFNQTSNKISLGKGISKLFK
jgi:hypothetical protein